MSRRMLIRQPFDLGLSLETGQAFRWRRVGDEGVRQRDWGDRPRQWRKNGGAWYSGVLEEYLVHLRQTDEGLEYRTGDSDGERDDVNLDRRLHDYFRLDDEIGEVYARLGRHGEVAWAIEEYSGLRLLRQEPWECLVSYLCSGTNSIRGIKQCVERIAQLSRRKVHLDGDERYVFPGPVQIAEDGQRALTELGLGLSSRSRNIYLMALRLSLDPLLLDRTAVQEMSGREAVVLLDSYSGIGPKIAGCVALMSLEKLDAFPVDRWMQRTLTQCDLREMPERLAERVRGLRTLTEAQQYRVADWAGAYFGQYAGYANQYLFHWVEPHKERAGRKGACPLCAAGPEGAAGS